MLYVHITSLFVSSSSGFGDVIFLITDSDFWIQNSVHKTCLVYQICRTKMFPETNLIEIRPFLSYSTWRRSFIKNEKNEETCSQGENHRNRRKETEWKLLYSTSQSRVDWLIPIRKSPLLITSFEVDSVETNSLTGTVFRPFSLQSET